MRYGVKPPLSVLIQILCRFNQHISSCTSIHGRMVMLRGGSFTRLVNFCTALDIGRGLGVAMVVAMGFFAAFCGSILAAITAVGTIMMPKMIEQGYPTPFVVVLAPSASLEALLHPTRYTL